MAILDENILKDRILTENQYYSILARMELKMLKEYRYLDEMGKEKKLTEKIALERINEMLEGKEQLLLTPDWLDKWWKKL